MPPPLDAVRAPVQDLYALADRPEGLNEGDVAQVVLKLRAAFQAIPELKSAAGLAADFRDEFPRQLIDYLLVEYLLINQRRWGYLLMALGISITWKSAQRSPLAWHICGDVSNGISCRSCCRIHCLR